MQAQSKAFDETGSLYNSKTSQKSPFMAAGSAASTMGNTSNLKGKLTSLEVSDTIMKNISYGLLTWLL